MASTDSDESDHEVSEIKFKSGFFVLTRLTWNKKHVVVEFRDVQTRKVFKGMFDSLQLAAGAEKRPSTGSTRSSAEGTRTRVSPEELGPAIEDALQKGKARFRYALRGFWLTVTLNTALLRSLKDKKTHATADGNHVVDLFLAFRPVNFMDMLQLQMSDFEASLEETHYIQEAMYQKLQQAVDRVNAITNDTDGFKGLINKYIARLRQLEADFDVMKKKVGALPAASSSSGGGAAAPRRSGQRGAGGSSAAGGSQARSKTPAPRKRASLGPTSKLPVAGGKSHQTAGSKTPGPGSSKSKPSLKSSASMHGSRSAGKSKS